MSSALDRIALLERLQALRDQGAISDEEFAEQKAALLEHTSAPQNFHEWERDEESTPRRNFYAGPTNGTRAIALLVILSIGFAGFYFWSEKSAAALETATQTYVVAKEANIRSGAVTSAKIIGSLKAEKKVTGKLETTDKGEQWLKLDGGDFTGNYVWAGNLKLDVAEKGHFTLPRAKKPASQNREPLASKDESPARPAADWLVGAWAPEARMCASDGGVVFNKDGTYYASGINGTWRIEGSNLVSLLTQRGESGEEPKTLRPPERNIERFTLVRQNAYHTVADDGSKYSNVRCPAF